MKQLIKDKLVQMHLSASTDEYGQICRFHYNLDILFGDAKNEVIEYIKHNPIISISCYARSGVCVSSINDQEIKMACNDALKLNKNRIYNLTKW